MNLISDRDLRSILKIKEDNGEWILAVIRYSFGIDKINKIYNENHSLPGLDFVDSIINTLNIKYSISDESLSRIPITGPFIIIANHPLGVIDGMLLLKLVCKIRPDFKLQGNFLIQHIETVKDYIIPVNPFENFKSVHSSYKGIRDAYQHLKNGNSLGIFPAGEVSSYQIKDFNITDREWQKSSVKFIQTAGVPVIPIYINGFNSAWFYLLGQIHPLLRTAKLPSEILNKSNQTIKIEIRKPIPSKTISTFTSIPSLSHYLRAKTYSLNQPLKIKPFFSLNNNDKKRAELVISVAVDPLLIQSDLEKIEKEYFLFSQGSYSVYCAPFSSIPHIIQEIGRLREITFRKVGEGTNNSTDLDQFDIHYHHLIIWDNVNKKIAGSYRIGKGKDIMNQYGKNGFYTNSLFRIKKGFISVLDQSFELGRSFIVQEYQRQPLPLFLLWKGIMFYLKKNPDYNYLIGPVTISNNFSKQSKSLIVQFINENYFDYTSSIYIKPRKKFRISKNTLRKNENLLKSIGNNIKALDLYLNELQLSFSLPVLMKKYLQMNGKIIGFNIDHEFNDCLDGLMLVNISDIPPSLFENLSKKPEESKVNEQSKSLCLS